MNAVLTNSHQSKAIYLVPIVLLFTLFLFYIDEGRYTLEGLFRTGNLVAMSLYFVTMLLSTFVVYQLFFTARSFKTRFFTAVFLGIPIGFCLTVGLFYLLRTM